MPTTYFFGDGSYIDRKDADLAVGWSATSNISLLGGVKRVQSNFYDYAGSSSSAVPAKFDMNYLGVNGFEAIGEKTFVYGTVTRSFSASRTREGVKTTGLTFTTYEVGLGFAISKEGQLTAGYRNQILKIADDGPKLSGFIVGTNFSF